MVFVETDAFSSGDAIVEANVQLLLDRQVCVAGGVVQLRQSRAAVLLANFSAEDKHLNKGATVAFLEDFAGISDALALSESPSVGVVNGD